MEHSKQLGEEKVSKLLIKFSIPAITGMVVNALYNVVDRIFVGQGVGKEAIAGITIGFPMMTLMMAFGMLIGLGATSLISIRLGEHNKAEAERIVGNALTLLVGISVIISVLGLEPVCGFYPSPGIICGLSYLEASFRVSVLG
jgi:Na+-driven multidrug efflux pump